MQPKNSKIMPFVQPMERAPFLCRIVLIVSDQLPGVKDKGISTLMLRVLIVYTQFMKSPAGGVY